MATVFYVLSSSRAPPLVLLSVTPCLAGPTPMMALLQAIVCASSRPFSLLKPIFLPPWIALAWRRRKACPRLLHEASARPRGTCTRVVRVHAAAAARARLVAATRSQGRVPARPVHPIAALIQVRQGAFERRRRVHAKTEMQLRSHTSMTTGRHRHCRPSCRSTWHNTTKAS